MRLHWTFLAVFTSLAASDHVTAPQWDLSWIAGIEYTPALVPGNSLWWWRWPELKTTVSNELKAANRHFGFNHLRMFLHNMVYDGLDGNDAGKTLFPAMSEFLDVAQSHGFKVSFTFFDDCWNHAGANLSVPCTPVKGRHNGCWMAAPQDVQRTSIDRFKPYVYNTVRHFASDSRIAFWEVYNEPNVTSTFSIALRSAAFEWIHQALIDGTGKQSVPILACWNDNNATQMVDMHSYTTNFSAWTKQVFQNPSKGALITEGGSRWYQGYDSDAGSPLNVLRWFHSLRSITPSAEAPFKFGMVTNWELMVGLSNTRWHWNTPDGTAEPVIPWDGYMFPDGTPVSYTEAAAVRNWTRGVDEFLAFDDFLPQSYLTVGDQYLCLKPGEAHSASLKEHAQKDQLVIETTVWLSNTTGGGLLLRGSKPSSQFFIGWRHTGEATPVLTLEHWEDKEETVLASYDMKKLDCGLAKNGWNMLRVVIDGHRLEVFANPMFTDAISEGIQPRFSWAGSADLFTGGGIALTAVGSGSGTDCTRFDFLGILDSSVLNNKPRKTVFI